jgi:hypothetical protein
MNKLQELILARNKLESEICAEYSKLSICDEINNIASNNEQSITEDNNIIIQESLPLKYTIIDAIETISDEQMKIQDKTIGALINAPINTPVNTIINAHVNERISAPVSAPKESHDLPWREQSRRAPKRFADQVIQRVAPPSSGEKIVQITENVSLPAICVNSFSEVKDDGHLYYVDSANHFAMYILKHLFHGNIGTIYTNEKMPSKIKNCQFHYKEYNKEKTRCNYYHDPQQVAGSNDVRNFVANSWLYNRAQTNEYTRQRVFGSLPNLEEDLKNITPDDTTRQRDALFHDLLCLLVLL